VDPTAGGEPSDAMHLEPKTEVGAYAPLTPSITPAHATSRSRFTVFFQALLPLRSRSSDFRTRSVPFSAPLACSDYNTAAYVTKL